MLNNRPRLKATTQYQKIDNNVYFSSAGESFKLNDPNGFVSSACNLFNGNYSVTDIQERLMNKYPMNAQYISKLIESLDEHNLLDNTINTQQTVLETHDITRWSRNTEFFNSYCKMQDNKFKPQEKLKQIKVTLLGLGGLGSHILYDLVALGVHNIKAIDYDCIELSNLNRQILYGHNDIGRKKTEVAKERISQFLPTGNFEFIDKKITAESDIYDLIKGSDFVIAVADQPRLHMQNWVNSACIKANIPFITGGVSNRKAMYCSIIPHQTGCIECWKKHIQLNQPISATIVNNTNAEYSPYDDAPAPAVVTFVSVLTGLMLTEFLKIVTEISNPQALAKLWTFDFDSATVNNTEQWGRDSDCAICGTNIATK